MKFYGNFKIGFEPSQRATIDVPFELDTNEEVINPNLHLSNGTLFSGTYTSPQIITSHTSINNTVLGILMVDPEGADYVYGDRADLTVGTIRIDIEAYEQTRLQEIEEKGSSTMANLSALLTDPLYNRSITGIGCVLQLVQVVR